MSLLLLVRSIPAAAGAALTRTVEDAAGPIAASDSFDNNASNGWGTADVGGAWTVFGTASNYSVTSGVATQANMVASADRRSTLDSLLAKDFDIRVMVRTTETPVGATQNVRVGGRYYVGTGTNVYRCTFGFQTSGAVTYSIERFVEGTFGVIGTGTVSGVTRSEDTWYHARVQIVGSSPTNLRIKFWQDGTAEPVAWEREETDSSAALQNVQGGVTLWAFAVAGYSGATYSTEWRLLSAMGDLTDSPARLLAANRGLSESIPIGADTIARTLAATHTLSDTVSIGADSISRTLVLVRGPPDSVTTTDDLVHDVETGSTDFPRPISDTTSVTDDVARVLAATRAISDTTSVTDDIVRSGTFTRGISDTVSTTDEVYSLRRGPTQFARPDADLAGNWHGEDARTTDLYTSVDDSPFNNATYIESPDAPDDTDYHEFRLTDVVDPETSGGHVVRYRYGGTGPDIVVELRQGTTVIASWQHVAPGVGPTLAEQTLTEAEADAITDYDDLRIRVRGAA